MVRETDTQAHRDRDARRHRETGRDERKRMEERDSERQTARARQTDRDGGQGLRWGAGTERQTDSRQREKEKRESLE